VINRDADALELFLERMRCIPRFLSVFNVRAGVPLGKEDLLDLSQDVFAVVWHKLPGYAGDAGLESWVFRIALFEFRNATRRTRRRQSVDLDSVEEPSADPQEIADLAAVHQILAQLDPLDARILAMKHLEGLTFEELAARLAMPVNTVKSRYYRSLSGLRDRGGRAGQEGGAP
jgi:RNA polymerase sigma-70 factor (ECF subfamily)